MRKEAAVIFESVKTTDDFAVEFVARKSIRNYFFGLGDFLEDKLTQFLQSRALRFLKLS